MEGAAGTGGEVEKKKEELPPGFRFHPTDEELITCYLLNKISDSSFTGRAIADVDLNKCEPWDLPAKAKMGEKEWYFFSLRDRKYPTGVRTNRATTTGYWKTTGKDKEIYNSNTSELFGMKKTLVFYKGRAPRGEKSNWVMHEYRVHSKSAYRSAKDEWVVCRVFQKSATGKKFPPPSHQSSRSAMINIDIGPNPILQPQPMIPMDPAQFQIGGARSSYMMMGTNNNNNHHVEFADLSRNNLIRTSNTHVSPNPNFPFQTHLNYPSAGNGAGCFTMSGLNLNLGGGGNPGHQPPFTRPMGVPPPPSTSVQLGINPHHDVNAAANMMGMSSSSLAVENVGPFGVVEVSSNSASGAGNNTRFVNMEHCVEFDGYWPNY